MEQKLKWYWSRLKMMTPEEIAHRMRFTLKKRRWRRQKSWDSGDPNWLAEEAWIQRETQSFAQDELAEILFEAERYLNGNYTLLNFSFHEPVTDWHKDPQTGIVSPMEFGPDLDYRNPKVSGNVKNIWEKNRHHHLTLLAMAYALSGKNGYLNKLENEIRSWIDQNPFPLGVNWTSSLELGVRLISWIWIERLIRDTPEHQTLFGPDGALWAQIYRHQWMIAEHYSVGSSSNNHLIGEMAGLYMASAAWPFFAESAEWKRFAKQILEREAVRQSFPGGLNREQAFSYHIFSTEFFLLAGIEGERSQDPFTSKYKVWVKRMLEAIPKVTDVGGNLPSYGDGDEGMALQLRPLNASRTDWLYRIGRHWLDVEVPLSDKASGAATAALVLKGVNRNYSESHAADNSRASGPPVHDSGNYVLAARRGQDDEIFCLADAAPLGYLSIAGHGHADALSFTLSYGGIPVIVDPGTYIYHAEPLWRNYFRGTGAHNTITIDGKDQSIHEGPFLWVKKAETRVLQWTENLHGAVLVAEHDGYRRLNEPVMHRRKLELKDNRLSITDELTGKGEHELEFRLHFAPYCELLLNEDFPHLLTVNWGRGTMRIELDQRLTWKILIGEEQAGWYSRGFNLKEPAPTLIGSAVSVMPGKIQVIMEVGQ